MFYLGQEIKVNIVREDYIKNYGFSSSTTNTLVRYNEKTNTVFVDSRCDELYAQYAALHEAICCGRFQNLAPKVEDPLDRCGMIDLAIIEYMEAPYRKTYIIKRIEMYNALIGGNFTPSKNEQFKHSLIILKKKLKEIK